MLSLSELLSEPVFEDFTFPVPAVAISADKLCLGSERMFPKVRALHRNIPIIRQPARGNLDLSRQLSARSVLPGDD